MKKLNILFLLFMVFGLSFSACKKDKSVTQLLTNEKGWVLKSAILDPGVNVSGVVITDFFPQFDACSKDDITVYKTGGVTVYDEGATKCYPSDPQTEQGTWILSVDEKTFTDEDGISLTIVSLTESELKLSSTEDLVGDGINRTITFTYSN